MRANSPIEIRRRAFCLLVVLWCGVVLPAGPLLAAGADDEKAKAAVELFKKTDPSIEKFFTNSVGYAVFPGIAKGALGVGAAHGNGVLFEKGKITGDTSLTQVTIGFQAGGQGYAEVIFFETKEALLDFKSSKLALSAQVSAVAAASGAAANAKYQLGVAVFTLAKGGLMYEASVGGQKFKFRPRE